MAIILADNTPRIEYDVAQGFTRTDPYPIPFAFFNKEADNCDVKVFVDGVERTLGSSSTTQFSILSGGNGAKGSLSTVVTGISGGSKVIILRDTKIGRITDFPSGGAFEVSKLNTELDTLVAIEGDFEDHVSRSIRLQDKDTAVSLALPLKADRLGKQLGFNATTGAVQMFTPESLAIASDSGSSSVDLTSNTFTFTGGEGIDTSISNQTLTITGELASTSNKGVASFNSTNFTVSSGAVTANDITLASDSGSATNTLGETFTLSGGTGLNTSATGSTVTMNVDAAQTGITSLLATDIKIGEDDQTKIDFETADQINFYANNVNVVQLSNANSGDAVFTVPTSDKDFVIKGNDGGSPVTALSIDMSDAGSAIFNNNVSINGNLTVTGTTTTVNSTTVNIADHNIVLDSDNSTSAVINGAGITIEGGSGDDATFTYNTIGPKFELKLGSSYEDLQVDNLIGNVTGDLTGTIQTAAQTNITSLGTLTGLTIDGDATFTGANYNAVWDKANSLLEFKDNAKATFGNDSDLRISHDGSNSFITEAGTGSLFIGGNALVQIHKTGSSEKMIEANADGNVELYFDNSLKFQTTSTGATVTGTLVSDGLSLGDSETISVGASDDLQIFHNGNNSFIKDTGTGALILSTNDLKVHDASVSDLLLRAIHTGATELYHSGSKKFETTATGATVTGTLVADGVTLGDSEELQFGAGTDLRIYHNGSHSFIREQGTGDLKIQSTNLSIEQGDGTLLLDTNDSTNAVQLYDNGELRLRTSDTGIDVLCEDSDGSSDNTANIRIISEGLNEIVTFRSNDGVASYISRNGDNYGTHLFQGFGTVTPNTVNMLQLTSTGHTFYQDLTLTKSSGDTKLFLEADSDNDTEGDNPFIIFKLDGGVETAAVWTGNFGGSNDNSLNLSSAGQFNRGISFGTSATNGGWETSTERMRIAKDGDITTFGTNGNITFDYSADTLIFDDDVRAKFGDSGDLQIYHDGIGSNIINTTGNLIIADTSGDVKIQGKYGEQSIVANNDGSVELYYDNVKKIETTSDGATVTGDLTLTSTDGGGGNGPILDLYRNSPSPSNGDHLGTIQFNFENDADEKIQGARIYAELDDDTDGTEDAAIFIDGLRNGSTYGYMELSFGRVNILSDTLQLKNNATVSFEGSTADDFETSIIATDPTADRTITLPDATGTINELLISSGSVSNVSSIDFNSSILTTEFSSYRLVLLNVKSATDNVTASFRLGTGNSADTGNNYMQSNWLYGVWNNSGSSAQSSVNPQISHETDQMVLANSFASLGTGTGENAHFEISLLNANSTSCYKHIRLNQSIYSYFPVIYGRRMDAGLYKTNSAINFMTIFLGSGNIASADYRLYGVK